MNAHTPGPWEAKFLPFASSQTVGKRAANGSLDLIASLAESVPQGEERDANSRLIAAAPEMLAALERAFNLIRESGFSSGLIEDEFDATLRTVVAAIAKAKGTP